MISMDNSFLTNFFSKVTEFTKSHTRSALFVFAVVAASFFVYFVLFSSQDKGDYKCTVSQYVQDIKSEGTVYLSSGMIRGEFTTQYNGQTIDSTFIVRDGYTYAWSSASKNMGFKVKAKTSASTEVSAGGNASGTYSFDLDQIGDYNCDAWVADETKFIPPTTITFTTM